VGGSAVFHLKIHTQFHLKDNSRKAKNEELRNVRGTQVPPVLYVKIFNNCA
jgi:hypothetical protein